jgi:pentatricopeptide repeat protein
MWNLRIPPKINAQWIYVQKDAEIKTHFKKRGRMIYERERLQVREHGQSPEVIKYKFKARQLLNLELYSVGSFRNEPEYKDARQVFFQLLKELKAYDEEAVTLCFRLVRRLLEELRARPNASQEQWICDPEFLLIEILVAWKKASIAGEHVYSALQVIEMMDENATIVRSFRLDAPSTACIVFVIARLVDANEAPLLAEKVLTLYWKNRAALDKKNVQRNRSLWNKLLFTWAKKRNSPDAPQSLKMILRSMYETPEITTNTASYNIVLQFFANKGMVKEVEETMDLMKQQHGIRQDLLMLSEAVTAFLIAQDMDRAEEFLDMMISELQNNVHARHQQRVIPEVLRKIFVAYQQLLEEANASVETKEELFKRAFALFQRVQKSKCSINLTPGK